MLGLDPPERTHLFDLAGVALPPGAGPYPTEAPDDLRLIVEGLDPNPAYLMGPRTDVLAWNEAAARLIGVPTRAPDGLQNVLWWLFTQEGPHPETRDVTARQTLARFRAEHARRYSDPAFRELIEALLAASPFFRELWPQHEVLEAQLGTKRIDHAELGPVTIQHIQSIPTSHPDLRLIQFVPADDATRAALAAS